MDFYLNTLNRERKEVFKKLKFIKRYDWYLAGGTGLALQIGHRTSIDFDFYTSKELKPKTILAEFEKIFHNEIEIIVSERNTLIINIGRVQISCFVYHYPLIYPLLNIENINTASIKDIAAMKMIAISQRGTKRDFIDMHYLLKRFTLPEIFDFTLKKYPKFNIYHALRSLVFFNDAEKEDKTRKGKIRIFDPYFSWSKIKSYLIQQVKTYQKSIIKQLRK